MENEERIKIHELRVDGGVSRNEFLMQFQSDMLNKKVIKASSSECTVLGVIYLAGLSLGYFKNLDQIKKLIKPSKIYLNKINDKLRQELHQGWINAVKKTIGDIK
jgi:glycerol kinase